MISIILAGGTGSRLWPLSVTEAPKQFLNLTVANSSLLRETYRRLLPVSEQIYVITTQKHQTIVKKNLPNIADSQIILEPVARGTTNALFLGLRRLKAQSDTPLFISWSDHYISDTAKFHADIKTAQQKLKNGFKLIQFGVRPRYPASHFGYLRIGRQIENQIFVLDRFLEKPSSKLAKQFFDSGQYLWNAGYFMTTSSFILSQLKTHNPDQARNLAQIMAASQSDLAKVFRALKVSNIDSDFSEYLTDAHLINCGFSFTDIGNFRDLHDISVKDSQGNTVNGRLKTKQVSNSYLMNQTDRQLALAGFDNMVIVVTENKILVANKDNIEDIGWLAKEFEKET